MKERIFHSKRYDALQSEKKKLELERFYARHTVWVVFTLFIMMMTLKLYEGRWL